VARLRDLLDRFRPVGSPGAASPVGVPADRGAELTAELEPIFTTLAEVERACAALRSEAAVAAERRRQAARAEAEAVVAAGREHAAQERAGAAVGAQQLAAEQAHAQLAGSSLEQSHLRARATERMPAFVDQVVVAVLARETEARMTEDVS
jgi:hypothetical protein